MIAIDWKGSSAYTVSGKKSVNLSSYLKSSKIKIISFSEDSSDDSRSHKKIKVFLKDNLSKDILISKDHSITFTALKALGKKIKRPFGLIVFDQHTDIYSYNFNGRSLNKSNVFRHCIYKNLVDHIVFVGIRPSEEALHNVPEVNIPEFDNISAEADRYNGIHAGLDDNISIIPSYKIKTFSDGLKKAFLILKDKGIKNIGIDIDLDCFDSDIIKGVDYTKDFPLRSFSDFIKNDYEKLIKDKPLLKKDIDTLLYYVKENDHERFQKELIIFFDKIKCIASLKDHVEYILWFLSELSQKGISPKIDIKKKLSSLALKEGFDVCYRGITEFEPANDDGKTLKIVNGLIGWMS